MAWIENFVVVPKSEGAKGPLKVRPWQADLIGQCFDDPRPRMGMWSLPRGQGKSTLAPALGLYGLLGDGVEGASVCIVAKDERQTRIIFNTAVRMVQMNPLLAKRAYIFVDRIYVPATGSTMQMLPAEADRLEGLDPSLTLIDEIGVVDRRVWGFCLVASGKRKTSLTLAIGTPSPNGTDPAMWHLRAYPLANPDDPSFRLTEFAAPDGCALDDEAAWAVGDPAMGISFLRTPSGHRSRRRPVRRPSDARDSGGRSCRLTTRGCLRR